MNVPVIRDCEQSLNFATVWECNGLPGYRLVLAESLIKHRFEDTRIACAGVVVCFEGPALHLYKNV